MLQNFPNPIQKDVARADIHVHSKYSDRPSEWLLRRIGAPESFTEPLTIYRRCRERGMDFVTVSDHNCIEAALEIAHLPGTFLASEVTTYFPENGCKVHCLVLGFNEEQFREIQRVRQNIYDFRRYVVEQDIIYSLAHPLFRVNDRLSVDQVEKLLLLFNRFEGINGTRDPRAAELVRAIFRQLTPELLAEMADRHGIEPLGPEPWRKTFTGGSDDHGSLYIASAWTETPPARNVDQYLEHIRQGRHEMGGDSGTSLRLAHSFYHIAYSFYKERLIDNSTKFNLIGELFRKLLEHPEPSTATLPERVRGIAGRFILGRRSRHFSPMEQMLVTEISDLFTKQREVQHDTLPAAPDAADDQRSFLVACDVSQKLGYAFLQKVIQRVSEGRFIESLQTLASLGPVAMSIAPYLAAFRTQHKDEQFLQAVAARFQTNDSLRFKSEKRAWITDTFADVNGVVRTIRALGHAARETGRPLTVVTCLSTPPADDDMQLKNFLPVGEFDLPEYESQRLAVPPLLEMIAYLEQEQFSELIISTPGPLGLCALVAGRLLGLRISGVYHTDFPRYVRHFTQDEALERITVWFMQWFYGQMDFVYAPSEYYRQHLVELGFKRQQLGLLDHGVDLQLFQPSKRQPDYWKKYGLEDGFHFIYVGRVSREKNLEVLLESFRSLRARMAGVNLMVVGDGPLLTSLQEHYSNCGIVFTGWLQGEELAAAYASSDALVFPSTTDTFGNVVLEAHACGLPAIVSHRGGPQEIVCRNESGLVVNMSHPGALTDAMAALCRSADLGNLKERALRTAQASSWQRVLEEFWNESSREATAMAAEQPLTPSLEPDDAPLALDLA